MRLTLSIPLLLGAFSLAACAVGPDRRTVLNTFVGLSETSLVQRLGVPTRTFDAGGHKFLAYVERHTEYIPGSPFFFGGGGFYGPGFGYAGGFPPEVVARTCETTFDVVGGRVQTWSLRGNACG